MPSDHSNPASCRFATAIVVTAILKTGLLRPTRLVASWVHKKSRSPQPFSHVQTHQNYKTPAPAPKHTEPNRSIYRRRSQRQLRFNRGWETVSRLIQRCVYSGNRISVDFDDAPGSRRQGESSSIFQTVVSSRRTLQNEELDLLVRCWLRSPHCDGSRSYSTDSTEWITRSN